MQDNLKVHLDVNGEQFSQEMRKVQTTSESVFKKIAGYASAYLSVELFKGFIGSVIEVTAQFEKFEAVLKNTTGSASMARRSMDDITKLAATTPFQIEELTAAYVRWTNIGLQPTMESMRKIGDVATSLGAGFEQTAEAFKDLMVGQTKRLEEVGISAAAVGNKIELSFKGQTIQIEKSAAGVQKALDVYSQMDGVLGAMGEVSTTVGVAVSNLNDKWTMFLKNVGEGSKNQLTLGINTLDYLLLKANEWTVAQNKMMNPEKTMTDLLVKQTRENEKLGRSVTERIANELSRLHKLKESHEKILDQYRQDGDIQEDLQVKYDDKTTAVIIAAQNQVKAEKAIIKALQEEFDAVKKLEKLQQTMANQGAKDTTPFISIPKLKENPFTRDAINNLMLYNYELTQTLANAEQIKMSFRDIDPIVWADLIEPDEFIKNVELMKKIIADLNSTITMMVTDLSIYFAEAFGRALGGQEGGLKSLLQGFSMMLVDFMGQIGKLLIGFGVAQAAFVESLKTLNPVALIAAGFALVALSTAIKSTMNKGPKPMANGGLVYGPSVVLTGEYSGARSNPEVIAPLNKLESMLGGMGGNSGNYKFRIEGTDLVAVLDKANNRLSRTT